MSDVRRYESTWERLVDQSPTGTLTLDQQGRIQFASLAVADLFERSAASLVGKTLKWACQKSDWPKLQSQLERAVEGSEQVHFECRTDTPSGVKKVLFQSLDMGDFGGANGIALNVTDVTPLRQLERRTENLTSRDPLTLLRNRSSYSGLLDQVTLRSATLQTTVCIAIINFDDFHLINEGYGIEVGDLTLIELAMRTTKALGAQTPIARLGNDEFAVIFEPGCDESRAQAVITQLLADLAEPIRIGEYTISVRATAGIASTAEVTHDARELMRAASAALRAAKASSRGHVVLFCEDMGAQVLQRAEVHRQFRTALAERKLRLAYQPIIDMQTGQIVSVEALSRWNDPHLGPVSPQVFIPIAEATNLMGELGDWVLETVCEQIKGWAKMAMTDFTVSVNVSGQQLLEPGIAERLTSIVSAHNVAPERIIIEVTESVLIDDTNLVSQRLAELRSFGFKLSIDDFGTGYSSLSYLSEYEFDILKIDRAFTVPLRSELNERDRIIVGAVIELARSLGVTTVAEGIEDETEFVALATLGCDYGQGYLFWEPLEVNEVTAVFMEPTAQAVA